jgi:hypothetical protein
VSLTIVVLIVLIFRSVWKWLRRSPQSTVVSSQSQSAV